MNIISSNYNSNEEECKIKTTPSYNEMDDVIKMDCLIDTINQLENLRDKLHEEMYSDDQTITTELQPNWIKRRINNDR